MIKGNEAAIIHRKFIEELYIFSHAEPIGAPRKFDASCWVKVPVG
jgi:hypothetical protein